MNTSNKVVLSLIFFSGLSYNIQAKNSVKQTDTYTGLWLTDDTETIIKISHCKQSLCGRIAGFAVDNKNYEHLTPNEKKKALQNLKVICSTDLLGGFKKESDHWVKGWIIDFETEKQYSATLQLLKSNTLKLHAYKGFKIFGETFIWKRVNKTPISCALLLQ